MNKSNYLVLLFSALALTMTACGGSSSTPDDGNLNPPGNDQNNNDDTDDTDDTDDSGDSDDNGDTDDSGDTDDNGDTDDGGDDENANDDEDTEAQTYTFYAEGLQAITLSQDGEPLTDTLAPGQYSPDSSVVSDAEGTGSDGQTVWAVQFNGTEEGNVFLSVAQTDFSNGVRFDANMQAEGVLHFDLYVDAIDEGTTLLAKIDSGWPDLSAHELDIGETGEWVTYSLPIADFIPNPRGEGSANFDDVTNPFVLEALEGTAIVHIDNIHYTCEIEDCSITATPAPEAVEGATLDIFMGDGLHEHYANLGFFSWDGGDLNIDELHDSELDTNVFEITYVSDGAGIYINNEEEVGMDLSSFEGGDLVFDLKVDDSADLESGFIVSADPDAGDVAIEMPEDNQWHTVRVPLSEFTNSGLDLTGVTAPFVILATAGEQAGVVFRVGNIRWEAAAEE